MAQQFARFHQIFHFHWERSLCSAFIQKSNNASYPHHEPSDFQKQRATRSWVFENNQNQTTTDSVYFKNLKEPPGFVKEPVGFWAVIIRLSNY
jgi:hypothetical protein